jgi:hypothetical protein
MTSEKDFKSIVLHYWGNQNLSQVLALFKKALKIMEYAGKRKT